MSTTTHIILFIDATAARNEADVKRAQGYEVVITDPSDNVLLKDGDSTEYFVTAGPYWTLLCFKRT